ncbi:hypothetical protein NQ315_006923 [Exocentrus adspersus]|uniref:C2HC/C3H-type domain-containing protein n=1 Tax=Exocentrus adspersus TaxID=1586481 RepID=A0AAV8WC72_9CUCU|nr:hypothetical protein NQ315_006923 [Exocentrus adspersus]
MALEKAISVEAGLHLPVEVEETPEEKSMSFCTKVKVILTNITVEPIMFCYILPSVMASITTQNLTLEKSCRVNLALDERICDALAARNETYPDYKTSEELVQKLSATMMIWKNIIQSLLPAILLLFLGSWSDRHKRRKPCILTPILGEITMTIGFLLCTYFFYQLPLEVNILAEALPPGLTGGWFAMFMGVFTYISGVTSEKTRTVRIGAVNMFLNVSICIGISLSGILYEKIGFYGVYSFSLVMYFVALVYGLFFVKDIREIEMEKGIYKKQVGKRKNICVDFFDFSHVMKTLTVCFKKGARNRRARICVIMVLVMVVIGPMHGEMNVAYFFVRYKYGWNSVDYSIFSTFQFVAHTIGTLFSLAIFTKLLKMDDAILGMISSLSKIIGCLFYAFAPTPLWYYFGAIAEMLNGTSFIAMRAIVSKLVPGEELGQINSLFGVAEAIIPVVYGPLYSRIYARTITSFPGAFFLVGGILTVPAVFIFIWLYFEHRRDKRNAKCRRKKPSGGVDFVGTFNRIWENHLAELVECRRCKRKFFPDRIEIHEKSCAGTPIKLNSKK